MKSTIRWLNLKGKDVGFLCICWERCHFTLGTLIIVHWHETRRQQWYMSLSNTNGKMNYYLRSMVWEAKSWKHVTQQSLVIARLGTFRFNILENQRTGPFWDPEFHRSTHCTVCTTKLSDQRHLHCTSTYCSLFKVTYPGALMKWFKKI